jgi:hypothetical protein
MSAAFTAASAGRTDVLELAAPAGEVLPHRGWMSTHAETSHQILLRNLGGKPLRLSAALLAEGSNRQQGGTHWHEIALYRTDEGQIAVALRLRVALPADLGVHRARLFANIDTACDWLEQFDGSADLDAGFDVADRSLSTASLAVKAASLRERAERLDRAYRGLVGEILFRLEADA